MKVIGLIKMVQTKPIAEAAEVKSMSHLFSIQSGLIQGHACRHFILTEL
jgi:hypothetical protein